LLPAGREALNSNAMRGFIRPILFCVEFVLCALPALLALQQLPAQETSPLAPRPAMFAAEGFIRLDASVTDRSDHPVTGLTAGDFTLLDNGQPAEILSFRAFNGTTAKPDAPTEVILVFDDESAFDPQVAAIAREIANCLERVKGPLSAPVSIVRFTKRDADETPQPTTDGVALARALTHPLPSDFVHVWPGKAAADSEAFPLPRRRPADIIGGRPDAEFSAGLPRALGVLGAIAIRARRSPGRKLLFWIGPEWKNELIGPAVADWITEFSTRLREARIALYFAPGLFRPDAPPIQGSSLKAIHSADPAGPVLGQNLAIAAIAQRSGGGVLDSFRLDALLAEKINAAGDFYSLTFAVPRTSQVDEYHELKLEVDKPNVTVRTSAGYFDEPVYYDQPLPAQPVAIAQLEQMLSGSQQLSDRECARKIETVKLTERMSSARLYSWETRMPGRRSRSALEALADLSTFLDPPPDEVVAQAAPDLSAQTQMLARATDYLSHAIPRLPDFFAVRTTVLFHQDPATTEQTWKTAMGNQSLHVAETTRTSIVLRHGKEVVEKEASRKDETLRTEGAFGPVLAIAFTAATSPEDMKWLRWERGESGPLAVYGYSIEGDKALFETGFCCLADGDGRAPFLRLPPAHGELTIDPESGAILRMTAVADLDSRLPLDQSALAVDYARLTIAGAIYVCPVRSVSFQRQRTVRELDEWGETLRIYGPFETILNDMTFEKYHLFHSNVHILPGFTPAGTAQ
jgi:VWFA-related protein